MISVAELDNIARARIEDAQALLTAGRFDGATYLCGYAFPLWNAVARWTVESRYNAVGVVQQPGAIAMIQAAEEMVAIL